MAKKEQEEINLVHLMAVTKLRVQKHLKNSLMSRIELCYEIYNNSYFSRRACEKRRCGFYSFTGNCKIYKFHDFSSESSAILTTWSQPPPQALRVSHGRGERETRVTGDEPQGTMGRVQTAGEAPSRPLSPSRLPMRAHFHRERENSGYKADLIPFVM